MFLSHDDLQNFDTGLEGLFNYIQGGILYHFLPPNMSYLSDSCNVYLNKAIKNVGVTRENQEPTQHLKGTIKLLALVGLECSQSVMAEKDIK